MKILIDSDKTQLEAFLRLFVYGTNLCMNLFRKSQDESTKKFIAPPNHHDYKQSLTHFAIIHNTCARIQNLMEEWMFLYIDLFFVY